MPLATRQTAHVVSGDREPAHSTSNVKYGLNSVPMSMDTTKLTGFVPSTIVLFKSF